MANEIEVGAILEGKVTGLTKFGAFVALPGGRSGLVHISEIAYSYVSEVSDVLSDGQTVKVRVIGIDENNRINLSIKRALPPPSRSANGSRSGERSQGGGHSRSDRSSRPRQDGAGRSDSSRSVQAARAPQNAASQDSQSFDDMLKRFMSDSDSKLSGRYTERNSRRRGSGHRN